MNQYSQKCPLGGAKLTGLATHSDFLFDQGVTILKQNAGSMHLLNLTVCSIVFLFCVSDMNTGKILINYTAQKGDLV